MVQVPNSEKSGPRDSHVKCSSPKWSIRAVLFVVIAGWMLWGPFYRQILNGKSNAFREWRMYGTRGLKSCRVDYFTLKRGDRVSFSRMEALDLDYGSKTWRNKRHLNRSSKARSEGRKLCKKFDLDQLFFDMRCGEIRNGWKSIVKESTNLCKIEKSNA